MNFGKTLLGLKLEESLKTIKTDNPEETYANAPLCRYPNGGCICKRILNRGPVKCFYKKGPEKCCFEKESSKKTLEKSKG